VFAGKIGWPEIVLILVIVLIIFGAGKLPQIGRALGQSIKEFKSTSKSEPTDKEQAKSETIVEAQTTEKKS